MERYFLPKASCRGEVSRMNIEKLVQVTGYLLKKYDKSG
jgi:hypothetical protein